MSGELLGTIGPANPLSDSRSTDAKLRTPNPPTPSTSSTTSPITALGTHQNPKPSLPAAFLSKKRKILETLHPPAHAYTDKSPKGSVDTPILDLIDEINAYSGLVTTSSCAGRVSVFLEGAKTSVSGRYGDDDEQHQHQQQDQHHQQQHNEASKAKSVPGGKGLGGRWLLVSHEPLEKPDGRTWSEMVGLEPCAPESDMSTPIKRGGLPRLVKFAFEPLILHVLCADLRHAAPLLAAAVNAGFRESGVQSLSEKEVGVMVGIRTAGLGAESIVGVLDGEVEGEDCCRAIVSEEYLDLLGRMSGERFKANEERRERFRRELREHMARFEEQRSETDGWEDKDARARRKRKEGLQRKEELRREGLHTHHSTTALQGDETGEDFDEV